MLGAVREKLRFIPHLLTYVSIMRRGCCMAKVMFLLNEDEVNDIESVMYEISSKDDTFRYKIVKSKYEEGKYVLIVYCSDKDEAHRRGMWIRDKVFSNDRLYWVK